MSYPKRKNPRLESWNYGSPSYYFVTFCTKNHKCLLGNVKHNVADGVAETDLSSIGQCCKASLEEAAAMYANIQIDSYVIMPNHIHVVVRLLHQDDATELGRFVRFIKGNATKRARKYIPDLQLWQRGYHDHIIRDERDYLRIREYVENNPLKWGPDRYYVD